MAEARDVLAAIYGDDVGVSGNKVRYSLFV